MRIGFLSGGVFWGLFLILIGVLSTLKSVLNWNIPIFRIVFALFIIYLGVSMLINNPPSQTESKPREAWDHPGVGDSSEKFTILFGQGTLDLTRLAAERREFPRHFETIFGSGVLLVNPDLPIKIKVNSAFAWAQMPDGNGIAFGQYTYVTRSFNPDKEYYELEADVVFGELRVVEK